MFEDISVKVRYHNTKEQILERLIAKYVEVKKFNDIYDRVKKTSSSRKNLLKSEVNRKRAFKMIHNEIRKRTKPEETYELWHDLKNVNNNVTKSKNANRVDYTEIDAFSQKILKELEEHDGEEDDEDELDAGDNKRYEVEEREAAANLQKITETFDTSSHSTKTQFLLRTRGLEILPYNKYEISNKASQQHVNNLKILLHLNVLRRKWDLAYKVFCLLIRFYGVDIRSIWPIGIEILRNKRELNGESRGSGILKEDKFFEWLGSFYVINAQNAALMKGPATKMAAPIWRSGSKFNAPLYMVTSLWSLLDNGDYTRLKDKLDELILEPPYNNEGVIYFLRALCYMLESVEMVRGLNTSDVESSDSDSEDSDSEQETTSGKYIKFADRFKSHSESEISLRVSNNLKLLDKQLVKCGELGFEYPRDLINEQITLLLKSIGNDDEEDAAEQMKFNQHVFSDSSDEEEVKSGPLGLDSFGVGDKVDTFNDNHKDEEDDSEIDSEQEVPQKQVPDSQQPQDALPVDNMSYDATQYEDARDFYSDQENNDQDKETQTQNMDFDFDFDFE